MRAAIRHVGLLACETVADAGSRMRRRTEDLLLDATEIYQEPAKATFGDLRKVGAHPDYWYPLAWSRELKPGKALAATFAGDPIVLVRDQAGAVFALEDRCAHRQVPLSCGLVEGGAIRCGYHGWAYDRTGRCTDVPYLGKGRLPNGVRAYPCREAEGLIFVFPARRRWPRSARSPRSARLPTRATRPGASGARSAATTPSCTRT